MSVFFGPAEKATLSRVVPPEQITTAVARNDARENLAGVVGPPLGGALFGLARLAPFAVDAASYLVSMLTVLALRPPLASEAAPERRQLRRDVGEGLRFVWRIPFLRASALQAMGTNVTWSSLVLALIVIARRGGASGAEVGLMLALFGLGGVLGSLASGLLVRRFAPPLIVIGSIWIWAALVAFMLTTTNSLLLGAIGGAALSLAPTWNGAVVGLSIRLTPDRPQGRVAAVDALLSFGARPFAMLAAGFVLEDIGGRGTLALIATWTAGIALTSTVSRALRQAPNLPIAQAVVRSG